MKNGTFTDSGGKREGATAAKAVIRSYRHWRLAVNADQTATLTCDDGNDRVVFTKQIEYTDFPLPEIRFYFIDNTLLL